MSCANAGEMRPSGHQAGENRRACDDISSFMLVSSLLHRTVVQVKKRRRAGSPRTSPRCRWRRAEPVRPSAASDRAHAPDGSKDAEHGGDEQQLTDLDADVEEQQRYRDVALRQADLAQRAGEAKARAEARR